MMSFASCIGILVIPYHCLPKHKLHQCLCTILMSYSHTYHQGMFVWACDFSDADFFDLQKHNLGINVLVRLECLLLEHLLVLLLVLLSLSFLSLTLIRVHGRMEAEIRWLGFEPVRLRSHEEIFIDEGLGKKPILSLSLSWGWFYEALESNHLLHLLQALVLLLQLSDTLLFVFKVEGDLLRLNAWSLVPMAEVAINS